MKATGCCQPRERFRIWLPDHQIATRREGHADRAAYDPGTTPDTAYAFLYWDINGHLYAHPRATFVAPTHLSSFAATAWYLLTSGGGPGGATSVMTYGFSLPKDAPLSGSPIASVAPSSAWTPPSAAVSTSTSVTITATDALEFIRWLAPDATVTGTALAAAAGVSTTAIAFDGPNPCQSIENDIASASAADFGPPDPVKEYQAYLHSRRGISGLPGAPWRSAVPAAASRSLSNHLPPALSRAEQGSRPRPGLHRAWRDSAHRLCSRSYQSTTPAL